MTNSNLPGGNRTHYACSCGAVQFHAGTPLLRILCHCTICQRFNEVPYADVLVFRAQDVAHPPAETINFAAYKPPPNVQRGKCVSCDQAAIEVFRAPALPKLTMVPRPMARSDVELPAPVAHIFYENRVSDADDKYPRHEGFVRSQLAFLKYYLAARRRL